MPYSLSNGAGRVLLRGLEVMEEVETKGSRVTTGVTMDFHYTHIGRASEEELVPCDIRADPMQDCHPFKGIFIRRGGGGGGKGMDGVVSVHLVAL